jgi:hypothetical protein
MTEDEAKTKWCPAYRLSISGAAAGDYYRMEWKTIDNRSDQARGKCIASACMAWRIDYEEDSLGKEGYCGLAGVPNEPRR